MSVHQHTSEHTTASTAVNAASAAHSIRAYDSTRQAQKPQKLTPARWGMHQHLHSVTNHHAQPTRSCTLLYCCCLLADCTATAINWQLSCPAASLR
jgi:hypothetical protein